MLNPFPALLTFSFFAPFLMRVAMAVLFFDFGKHTLTKGKVSHGELFEALGLKNGTRYASTLGYLQIIVALMFLVGFYTQIAALISLFLSLVAYYLKGKHGSFIEHRRHVFFLTTVISLSLLLSGGGAFAVDLPL